jgi:putative GTP pyrophosphokinase
MADNTVFPERNSLLAEYEKLLSRRALIVRELENCIEQAIAPLPSHPRVKGRLKSFDSYFKKFIRLLKEGSSVQTPIIADVLGVRVICPFLEDLAAVEELLKEKFKVVEVQRKGGDHTYREFGYESIHLLIEVPEEIIKKAGMSPCQTAEIQIRTILQDAWAEVEHEFVYKAEFIPFDNPLKRKLAAINASLSLADIVFQETRSYLRLLGGELDKRRDSFFKKIEESTDAMLFSEDKSVPLDSLSPMEEIGEAHINAAHINAAKFHSESIWTPVEIPGAVSIDGLLVEALTAHNKNQFPEAIAVYTRILDMEPVESVGALIYKHRGMAHFASSHYEEAIADFSESYRLDPKSYKASYYEGIACSVLQRYTQAVEAFNRSLEINPYQPYCLFRRGQAYYHLADYPHALGDCEAALVLESFEAGRKFKELLLNKLKM